MRTAPTLSRLVRTAGLLTILIATSNSRAETANLLRNGDFTDHLSGWSRTTNVLWSPFGAAAPGSARIVAGPRTVAQDVMIQCLDVEGGRLYDLAASTYLPLAPGGSGGVSLRIEWHPEAACQGPALRGSASLDFSFRSPVGWQSGERRMQPAPFDSKSALVVVVARADGRDEYSFSLDDVTLRRSVEGEVLTIPTAASVTGALGQTFQTDLWVHNPSPASRSFVVQLRCPATVGCGDAAFVSSIQGRGTVYLPDVLKTAFGRREAGAIEVLYDPREGPFTAYSRVSTSHAASPGNGAAIPALTRDDARTAALFVGLAGATDPAATFRVNAGVYNPSDAPVAIRFVVEGPDGLELGSVSRTYAGREWFQIADVPAAAGVSGPLPEGTRLRFGAARPVFPFVLVIDNRTGDATYAPPVDAPEGY